MNCKNVKIPGGGLGAYHVLKVHDKSPAAEGGLEAFFDFIVVANGTRLKYESDELDQILATNSGKAVELVVYSCKSEEIRTISVTPRPWTGNGLLGISLRFCSLHGAETTPRILYIDIASKKEDNVVSPTNTVGLQVDFEDPDVFYFAGGRHVSLQTDADDEFGPLDLFVHDTSPVVLVKCSVENDINGFLSILPAPNPPPAVISKTVVVKPSGGIRALDQDISKTIIKSVLPIPKLTRTLKAAATSPPSTHAAMVPKRLVAKPGPAGIVQCQLIHGRVRPPTKVQIKNVVIPKKREIGEDGWETVRGRNNRSKWSLSSRSSSSSTNDLAMNGSETGSKDADAEDAEDETVAAEEEKIQEKEAALDSAIREEELIEQELLQVEKDFLQIENQVGPNTNTVVMRTKSTETERLCRRNDFSFDASGDVDLGAGGDHGTDHADHEEIDDCFYFDIAVENHNKNTEDLSAKELERILALREKLMSPAKCRDSAETLRRHQAKLAKAEMNRERLLEAKYNRYVELSERFQTLNETTRRLVEERSELIARAEERRKRAVEKRQQLLLDIKRKAQDEEFKAKEIAFINLLESQMKRSEFRSSAQAKESGADGRLQSREEERKLKLEDRFHKLSAVLDRQSKIKRDWETKLAHMQEKRRRTSERILREKQKRAQERTELAQEKAREREERISALNAAKQAKKEELKKSIQQKQQDTARRHEENMEHIRQKAIELSAPRSSEDTPVRICTLCKVVIESEVQELAHLRGRAHLDAVKKMEKEKNPQALISGGSTTGPLESFGIKFITDIQGDKVEAGLAPDKNRLKVMKKHCKKLLLKLTTNGTEFEKNETPPPSSISETHDLKTNKNKIQKNIREMDRLINLFNAQRGTQPLANTLDRLLADTRKNAVRCRFIQDSLVGLGLFPVLQKILQCRATDLPQRVLVGACNLMVGSSFRNLYNSVYVLRSTAICAILELSSRRWEAFIPDGHRWLCASPVGTHENLPVDLVIAAAIESLSTVLNVVPDPFDGITSPKQTFLKNSDLELIHSRNLDVIGFIVGSGIVDRLSIYCSGVRRAIEGQQMAANLLKDAIDLLTMLVYSLQTSWDQKKPENTQLLAALESSEIAGAISMSYSLLLHQGAPTRPRVAASDAPIPPAPGLLSASLLRSTLSLINAFAKLDLTSLQRVLGSEAVSLQFRHIASQLLWQVVPYAEKDPNSFRLVHELLIALGNFIVGNKSNQLTIQAGQTPTVLQQLCALPKPYFNDEYCPDF